MVLPYCSVLLLFNSEPCWLLFDDRHVLHLKLSYTLLCIAVASQVTTVWHSSTSMLPALLHMPLSVLTYLL